MESKLGTWGVTISFITPVRSQPVRKFTSSTPLAILTMAIHHPRRQARRYARFIGTRTAGLGAYTGATFPYATGLAT